jgi:hypothetical protein
MTMGFWRAASCVAGLGLVWSGSAQAALISFTEDPAEVAPIAITTDLAGATEASTLGSATLTLGAVTGGGTTLLDIALIQPGTNAQTGGGKGVSDILKLQSFSSGGSVVGFEATYLSDRGGPGLSNPGFPAHPTFCSTAGGPEPACPPSQPNSEFVKTGALMSFLETVTLPGVPGPTSLAVDILSPLQAVPEPAGLALFLSSLAAMLVLTRRKALKLLVNHVFREKS